MILSHREILEGQKIPKYYGIAWPDYNRQVYICYPFPLNLIIGFIKLVYYKVRYFYFKSEYDEKLRDAYLKGMQEWLLKIKEVRNKK